MLEIELKESLRRRQDELRSKIETLGAAEVGDASAAEDLETRNRELKALSNTVESLQKKLQGETFLIYTCYTCSNHSRLCAQKRRKRLRNFKRNYKRRRHHSKDYRPSNWKTLEVF